MIEYVRVGGHGINVLMMEMSNTERGIIVEKINNEIFMFTDNGNFNDSNILTLCKRIADIFSDNAVSSHFIEYKTLVIFVDLVDPDVKSRYFYTPHYKQAH